MSAVRRDCDLTMTSMEYRRSGSTFLALLLTVSAAPFLFTAVQPATRGLGTPQYLVGAIALVLAASNAHVFSTLYLLGGAKQLKGVQRAGLKILAVPLAFFALNVGLAYAFGPLALTAVLPLFVVYGTYHFGRQNLGVHAYACRITQGRAMSAVERRTIVAGVFCGIVQSFVILVTPLFGRKIVSPQTLDAFGAALRILVVVGYAAISVVVAMHVVSNRRRYQMASLATYLISVYFFAPVMASPWFLAAATYAHGMQYLVFLGYHAAGDARLKAEANRTGGTSAAVRPFAPFARMAVLVPFLILVTWTFAGHVFGRTVHTQDLGLAVSPTGGLILYLTAIFNAATLSHYWIDQHLWRFTSPERREWLLTYFPFLGGLERPRTPVAVNQMLGT